MKQFNYMININYSFIFKIKTFYLPFLTVNFWLSHFILFSLVGLYSKQRHCTLTWCFQTSPPLVFPIYFYSQILTKFVYLEVPRFSFQAHYFFWKKPSARRHIICFSVPNLHSPLSNIRELLPWITCTYPRGIFIDIRGN